MINLILKDILLLKKTLLLSAIYPLIFMFAFQSSGIAVISSSIIAVTYILVLSACAYDDKNKSDVLWNSLPVGKSVIVLSRYLSVYVFLAIGILLYMAAYTLVSVTGILLNNYPLTIESIIAAITAVTLLNSIYFPVFFKIGYVKSRMVNFILFFSAFFGVSQLAAFITRNIASGMNGSENGKFIESAIKFIAGLSDVQIALGIVVIMLIIVSISYSISLRFYKNREF
jgi:ABC-2 type transport system permease protein